jgi:HSP20 family protein
MARASKGGKVSKESIVPVLSRLPAFPQSLVERIDDFLGERWGPWWPMLRWPEELARMPTVDVYEEGDQVVVKAEVPGMRKEEIDVRIAGDVLTISGKKEKEEKVERKDYYRYERSAGEFSRSVQLPAEVQADKVQAQLKEGVLEIRAPKTAEAKSRSKRIEVT